MKKCAVIGSINTDMVASANRFPAPGETVIGNLFRTEFGGKGANQAIALARLGVDTRMVGKVGGDIFGKNYLEHMHSEGVNTSAVEIAADEATGIADIRVNASGENSIVVVPGANTKCVVEWLNAALSNLKDCEIFLLQLEIPLETVGFALKRLREMGKTVILDPAPATALPDEWLACCDYITPNATELEILTGELPSGTPFETRIAHLAEKARCTVIHKRGAEGAFIGSKDAIRAIPGFRVKAVDTTAAGDTFNAGLAAGLSENLPLEDCVRLANAAGALSVTAFGAQSGMPTRARIREEYNL